VADLGRVAVLELARRLWPHLEEDDIAGLAAELGFRSFLELFPFFVFLSAIGDALAGWLHIQNPAQQVLGLLSDSLPTRAADPIRQQLEAVVGTRPPGLAVLSVLGAVWIAAGGGASLLKALNRVYRIQETRPWWERQLVGLAMSLLGGSVICLAVFLLGAGQLIGQAAGGSSAPAWFSTAAGFARWPLLLAVLMIEASVVFRVAPDSRLPWRWVTPGAVVFGLGWLSASFLFVVYVNFAGGYASSYGVLGGVVVILLWLHLTMYALLLGAEINAQLEDPAAIERAGGHPVEAQGAAGASRPTHASGAGPHRARASRPVG
jgi:membrane protein